MAVTFTRAETVSPGEAITSTQAAKLALAFNDRLRSGLGDGPWRLRYYWLSLFRQVRNPDASGFLFPSQAEFLEKFQNLEPEVGEWPITEPGDPEGANLASQMMGFIFGNPQVDSEDIRLGDEGAGGIPLALGVMPPTTPAEYWELAKRQRGAYDPDTGNLGSPAITAAKSYGAIYYSPYSPHGNSYGDWVAGPQVSGTCEDPDLSDSYPAPPNFDVFFTKLDGSLSCPADTSASGDECHYAGTCPIGPDTISDYSKHVAGIAETPWSYFVFLNDGTVQELPKSQWIIGPFHANAVLRKQGNNILARCLNAFAAEFRGTEDQRSTGAWNGYAFDFQRFLRSQYLLAPNLGSTVGDSVTASYPSHQFGGALVIPNGTTGTEHMYRAGFVFTGAMASATKLGGSVGVEVLDGETVIGTLTLTPDELGNASAIYIATAPRVPSPLNFRLKGAATFTDSTGVIDCEATELVEYKPQLQDLYAVLRLSGISFSRTVDGRGIDEEQAKLIGQNYFSTGCILSVNGDVAMPGSMTAANTNAVFDAARRFSKMIRLINRENFIGYEVADGKSVCYFNRLGWSGQDLFEGIAPPREEVATGSIREGIVYEIRDASVVYDGTAYAAGLTFTGVAGKADWTGEGHVFEHEGIAATAPKRGFTNEWLMGAEFKAYHLSESSTWKPSAYGDYFPLNDRCLFFSPEIANDDTLLWHTAFGQRVIGPDGTLITEAPTGYRYATLPEGAYAGKLNVNTVDCAADPDCEDYRLNFYKSCRLYEPEPEIESCTVLVEEGIEVVKMVFKTRFHHAPSAPGSIDRDYSAWVGADLAAEEFRSVENALREYLLHIYWGGNCTPGGDTPMGGVPTGQPGNAAMRSQVQTLPYNPNGTCYPHFGFTKLIPIPYDDGNDKQNSHDTPLLSETLRHAETVLRAMCEGFIDGYTTETNACDYSTTNLYAYQFENLLHQASGGTTRWIPFLPSTITSQTTAADIREDAPEGFGPLPNTRACAETFNLIANAVNLLTDVRVMLPFTLECKTTIGEESIVVGGVYNANSESVPPNADSYSGGSAYAVWTERSPSIKAPDTILDDWAECSGGIIPVIGVNVSWNEGAQEMTLSSQNVVGAWRWTVIDPDAINAIPETWRDMLEDNALMLASREDITRRLTRRQVNTTEGPSCTLGGTPDIVWDNATGALTFDETVTDVTSCQLMPATGTLSAPALPESTYYVAAGTAGPCAGGASTETALTPLNLTDAMIRVPLV